MTFFFTMDLSTANTVGCTQEGYSKVSQYLINTGKPNTYILFNKFQKCTTMFFIFYNLL